MFVEDCIGLEGRTSDPSGTESCDVEHVQIEKLVSTEMRVKHPRLFKTFTDLTFSPKRYTEIVKFTRDGDGEHDLWGAACKWIKTNQKMIQKLIPKCEDRFLDQSTLMCKGEN